MARGFLTQQRFSQSQVPFPFVNTEELLIPAYAAMIIEEIKLGPKTGELVAFVRRCTEADEKAQNHTKVLFNGKKSVGKKGRGVGTRSAPAVALLGRYGEDENTPEVGSSVGPARDSWKLWKGGGTHTLEMVLSDPEDSGDVVGLVGLHTSPGLWVKTDEVTGVSEAGKYVVGTATLQNAIESNDNGGDFEDAESEDSTAMEIEFKHGGGDVADGSYAQVKMTSGGWALDVEYCEED